ncbi:MAG: helix-turn-helix domain-containing protein [Moraxellaceae bacterium]|nr:helix-turn-helix domain-containing protein [Moraxellaceae bacterium]
MSLHDLDLLLRGATLGLALLFFVVLLRAPQHRARAFGLGLAAGVSAYLLMGALAMPGHTVTPALQFVLRSLAIGGLYCFWALARLLFEDDFQPRAWHGWLFAGMLLAAALRAIAGDMPGSAWLMRLGVQLPALALAGHLSWRVLRDRERDLVEPRRRWRLAFAGAGSLLVVLSLGLPPLLRALDGPAMAEVLQAASFLLLKLILGSLLLAPRLELLGLPVRTRQAASTDMDAAAAELRLAQSLRDSVRRDGLYRETGISVAALARHLALPEYRLRQLINQQLGYRNFNDFMNSLRIDEARRRLRDPAEAHLPILSIALDLGFGSIGPFNRAFKASLGLTPSAFRRGDETGDETGEAAEPHMEQHTEQHSADS